MKKKLIIYIAILTITLSFTVNNFGQIGDWIKLAKDAIEKKKNKKKEKTDNPQTKNEQTNTSGQPSVENDNSDEARTETVQTGIGKIYFSNKPFTTNHDGSKTSFTTGEYIYGRLEVNGGTLREVLKFSPLSEENPQHKLLLDFYIYNSPLGNPLPARKLTENDYTQLGGGFVALTEADLDKTYWNFDVLPEPAKTTTRIYNWTPKEIKINIESENGPYALYKYLKEKAEEQTSAIKIELQRETRDFRGNLETSEKWLTVEELATLDFKKTDYPKIKADGDQMVANRIQRYEKAKEDAENAEIANEPLPSEWTLKSNPLLPGLTESSLKVMFQYNHPYWVQKQIIKLYAGAATSSARTVVPNELGIPNYRYLNQRFTFFVKVVGEDKCFYQSFNPSQRYTGGGSFGDFYAILEGRVSISCAKMGVK